MKKFIYIFIFLILIASNSPAFAQERLAGSSASVVNQSVDTREDNRIKVLKDYLGFYNSPLAQNSDSFVKYADEYNIDWRLLASISGVESTFGKFLPYNSYNAWGWGIYGDNMIRFASYDEAIKTISKSLREKYIDEWGADDVYSIGRLYAASPTWASRVSYFMQQIDDYQKNSATLTLSVSI